MKLKECACIILYDDEKRVLLQHRTKDAERLPDYWAFFGGHVENGETPKEAAIREINEEINFISRNPRFILKRTINILRKKLVLNVFIEEFHGNKGSLVLREGQGWGWFKIDETTSLKMIPHDRKVLQFIKDKL